MQAPEYADRLRIIADMRATDPTSRLAQHGMRDIVAIVIDMISLLALSFCEINGAVAILWHDLRNNKRHIEYAGATRPVEIYDLRAELVEHFGTVRMYVRDIYMWAMDEINPAKNKQHFSAGCHIYIRQDLSLKLYRKDKSAVAAPKAASTVRFAPGRMSWIDSNGQIHTEKY